MLLIKQEEATPRWSCAPSRRRLLLSAASTTSRRRSRRGDQVRPDLPADLTSTAPSYNTGAGDERKAEEYSGRGSTSRRPTRRSAKLGLAPSTHRKPRESIVEFEAAPAIRFYKTPETALINAGA